eukprot:10842934-Lingulodinium_polyedra.AAC.1
MARAPHTIVDDPTWQLFEPSIQNGPGAFGLPTLGNPGLCQPAVAPDSGSLPCPRPCARKDN